MKFRTEIEIKPFRTRIGYDSRIFAVGSCFAENIAERLAAAKFSVKVNPAGAMFNPISAADIVEHCAACRHIDPTELCEGDEGWFHFGFHGSFSRKDIGAAVEAMNMAVDEGHLALNGADTVIVTFGTSYVFRLAENDVTVANCHKQPAEMFIRERLTVDDIVARWSRLIDNELCGKHIILTVSPVRHLADGLDGNMLSKSILRMAVAELAERHENVDYFPSYEILCDDLRDYRFYADDLVHPSQTAIGYIWDKFVGTAMTAEAQALIPKVEAVVAASKHRPLHPDSESWRIFCRRQIEAIDRLRGVDLCAERRQFADALQ